MSDYMVVAMQRRCDKYIVPALKLNIIIVATAAHSIAMFTKEWPSLSSPRTWECTWLMCVFSTTPEPAGAAQSRE